MPPRLLAAFIASLLIPLALQGNAPPNAVLIMCDDLGWGDVGFNGNESIQTPHLDEMAAAGLRLNRFYAAAPVCSPARGSVVTGRHPFRYGIYGANSGHLKEEEFTLYEAVKPLGYRTGHFGKWHMGTLTTRIKDANRGRPGQTTHYSVPWHHEVDATLVTESKVPTYDPMIFPTNRGNKQLGWFPVTAEDKWAYYGTHFWTAENEIVPVDSPRMKGDDSRIVMDAALPFIEQAVQQEEPFLAVVWFHAPHLPVVAGPEHAKLYPDATEFQTNYYGCITALDEQVGRLRAKLRELGVAENTIVTFCSDNGPESQAGKAPGTAAHFRGRKRDIYEGGIRVPSLIEWPAVIQSGSSTDFPAGTVDYFPTLREAIGFQLADSSRPMDGISLLPVFRGELKQRPEPLAFQDNRQFALSDNRYKLYSGDRGKTWELYDLIDDPSESQDLAAEKPEVVEEMAKRFTAWKESCARSARGDDY